MAVEKDELRSYLVHQHNLHNLEELLNVTMDSNITRAKLVKAGGDSKIKKVSPAKGFLFKSSVIIPAMLNHKEIEIIPNNGKCEFVFDWENFTIPSNVVVLGFENFENFKFAESHGNLFPAVLPENPPILYVCSYPQENSALRDWLRLITNRYIHFGDLDLAGIGIFLREFRKDLGERSSFLIPPDYEERIMNGLSKRYTDHLLKDGRVSADGDMELQSLIDCIHKYHKGYDQEGFIEM